MATTVEAVAAVAAVAAVVAVAVVAVVESVEVVSSRCVLSYRAFYVTRFESFYLTFLFSPFSFATDLLLSRHSPQKW